MGIEVIDKLEIQAGKQGKDKYYVVSYPINIVLALSNQKTERNVTFGMG